MVLKRPECQGDDAVLVARADHHVHLPMPDPSPGLHGGGALSDVALAGQAATLLLGAVAFAISDRLAKVLPQGAACFAVLLHSTVDRLVADLEKPEELQPAADLFGAEPVAQKHLDQFPLDCAELAIAP